MASNKRKWCLCRLNNEDGGLVDNDPVPELVGSRVGVLFVQHNIWQAGKLDLAICTLKVELRLSRLSLVLDVGHNVREERVAHVWKGHGKDNLPGAIHLEGDACSHLEDFNEALARALDGSGVVLTRQERSNELVVLNGKALGFLANQGVELYKSACFLSFPGTFLPNHPSHQSWGRSSALH